MGVFCLEGDWDDQNLRDRRSVQPLLDLLDRLGSIEYIRRDVGTIDELEYYIAQWTKRRYDNFPVLYLAFHGKQGNLWVGRETYSLEDLAECLHHHRGGQQSVVHFGSCSTIRVSQDRLERFSKRADVRTVSGFSKDVDWADSAVLELALLNALAEHRSRKAVAYKRVLRDLGPLAERLGFHHT